MTPFTYGRKTIRFGKISGEVIETQKYNETRVSSSGGGGGGFIHPKYGGIVTTRSPQIHSETIVNHEFWLKRPNGEETAIKLRGADIPLRAGQKVTVLTAGLEGAKTSAYSVLINHSAGKHWYITRPGDLVGTRFRMERPTGISILLALGTLVLVAWVTAPTSFEGSLAWSHASWGFACVAAVAVFVYRVIRKYSRYKKAAKALMGHLEELVGQVSAGASAKKT